MPSAAAITQTVNSYLRHLAEGATDQIVSLYTADATIEDPIGADVLRGHDAIRAFYAAIQDAKKDTELAEIRVGGNEAAFLWHLTLDAGDSRTRISPISVMTFDDDAKVASMRAFWSPSDVRVL
ncbi:nuclear transport factor 2 family protein [Mycobacterium sherrisii]|uniref:Steroid delta-isomerase n=1 Tax=Mycobacterium sherrisii TaxID=243061 RepID=A0A1E3T3T9_9MYCO|nr:nuclear transport factor 2 family protein [Mycobacterium sherrisii]MEC4762802.1 nuclear transport factor 2 family protein [Mycobacterium sherrisii]ODR09029.1 steroid delta-isomerase [Mycobacterium sherrisii]